MSDKNKTFLEKLYNTVAYGGRIYTHILTIILTVFAVVVIFTAIYLIIKKPIYTISNVGTVVGVENSVNITQCKDVICKDPVCIQKKINDNVLNFCSFRVLYKDKDGLFNLSNLVNSVNINIKSGDEVPIFINQNDKLDVSLQSDDFRSLGWFLIVFVLLILLISWGWLWIVNKSKFFAALQGTSTAVDIVNNIF